MKPFITTILLNLVLFSVFSQNTLSGVFVGTSDVQQISLYAFNGIGEDMIANAIVKEGRFSMVIPASLEPGLLVLENNQNKSNKLFLIYNNESISFTSKNWESDSTQYLTTENKVFSFYEKQATITKEKIRLINAFMKYYPDKDKVYDGVIKNYRSLSEELAHIVDSIQKNYPLTYASALIQANHIYAPDLTLSKEEQLLVYRNGYWNNFPFHQESIIRSDVIMSGVREYFMLHIERSLPKQKQNEVFKQAVVKLFSYGIEKELVKTTFLENVHRFFSEMGNTDMAYFIDKNYIISSCETATQQLAEERITAFERTQPGNRAPFIQIKDLNGKSHNLVKSTTDNNYIILHFWSSTCSHCKEGIPELDELYNTYASTGIAFMSISLDDEIKNCETFVKENKLNKNSWTHFHEEKGWKSKVIRDYGINSTPTYFILNSEWVVESKPLDVYEIKQFLLKHINNNG